MFILDRKTGALKYADPITAKDAKILAGAAAEATVRKFPTAEALNDYPKKK